MAEITPMMKQYLEIKEQNQDCILFFRLGDFYEMFLEDAKLASKELDLTLTTRDRNKSAEDQVPMCGVPYHSCEGYIARLVSKGYNVAICEQMEDPALAKGLVKREITRIITPGTVTESSMLEEKRSSCARQEIAFHELALPFGAAEDTERRIGELEEMLGAFETAHHNLDAARETWQAWQEQLRTSVPEAAPDKRVTPRFDREQTDRRIEGIETHSRQVRMEIERGIGQMSALGDVSQLSQRQTELEEQIRRLESRYEALKIALEVLDEANGEMQKRFSPEIGRLAGQILSRLTGGKYDQLTFDREFSAMVRAAQGAAPHSAMALSKGTGEQVYLALRLALYRMLSDPADPCPIILDDALAYFDDERAALALQYLAELAEDRQILLFTCHSREAGLLRGREKITVMKL